MVLNHYGGVRRAPINDDKWSLFSSRSFEIEEGENDVFDLQDEFQKMIEPIKERIGNYIVQSLQERMKTFCNREDLEQMRGIRAPEGGTKQGDKRPTIAAIISNESIKRFLRVSGGVSKGGCSSTVE